jgi:hypothetical protein
MANPTGNPQNLNLGGRFQNLDSTETAAIGRKGALASNKVQKQKKTMQQLAQMMASCKPSKKVQKQLKDLFPDIDHDSIDNSVLMLSKIFEKAVREQDVRAFEVFRDTAGEKPVDKKEVVDNSIKNIKVTVDHIKAAKKELKKEIEE